MKENSVGEAIRLTPRQQEIVELMAEGHNPESIGNQLDMAPKTVHAHCAQIRQRLGVNSSLEVVAWFYKTNWQPRV